MEPYKPHSQYERHYYKFQTGFSFLPRCLPFTRRENCVRTVPLANTLSIITFIIAPYPKANPGPGNMQAPRDSFHHNSFMRCLLSLTRNSGKTVSGRKKKKSFEMIKFTAYTLGRNDKLTR